ncbi:3-isopropylmalate dehydrogenase [Demequina zhanjiangensis]|uniref:3-isopropylmalate dehydrogenase n=1 Tax=Demequina zhanjiangensis TaxID=3051659 RepID=A0ABT8FYC8_9MICO|nr:3-isopropylmalate dehydrogenase [Demequina sp. SYSU T00b26]MDN4471901.1 3-isopropylmalate dehydrogenase [Demequina sp. SYSU T00b26]
MLDNPRVGPADAEKVYKLAVVAGDGIGPEVVKEGLKCLAAAIEGQGIAFDTTEFDLGANRWHATGETLTDTDLEAIKGNDVILLGAIGDPTVPSGVLERGVLLPLRFALDQYVNLRPSRLYPGEVSPLANPGDIDFVVVREGTEGPYVGNGGALRVGTPHEIATEVSVNTRHGVERVVRYAFDVASKRDRKHVTLVHKHNVLVHAGHLWRRSVEAVAQEFPTVSWDYLHVDAATIKLVTDPASFDVIVTDNLFGDILTDEAAAISGGIGLAASGNVNPDKTAPSMFEPVHGSAPDIAGQGKADPSATVLSVGMLLDFLGYGELAAKVEAAVAADAAEKGAAVRSTSEVGDALAARIRG